MHDRILYKERSRIERMFGHLKINRVVATRYYRLAQSFLSMIQIAATRYLLGIVYAAWQDMWVTDFGDPRAIR